MWVNESMDLEGVHGSRNAFDIELARLPMRQSARSPQISAQQWGAATKDEVATRVHGVCPLPMGIEREETCE